MRSPLIRFRPGKAPVGMITAAMVAVAAAGLGAGTLPAVAEPPDWIGAAAIPFPASAGAPPLWSVPAAVRPAPEPFEGDPPPPEALKPVAGQVAPLERDWPVRRGLPGKSETETAADRLAARLAAAPNGRPVRCGPRFARVLDKAADGRVGEPLADGTTLTATAGPAEIETVGLRAWTAVRACDLPALQVVVRLEEPSPEVRGFVARLVGAAYGGAVAAEAVTEAAATDLVDACLAARPPAYSNHLATRPSKSRLGGYATNGMLDARCATFVADGDQIMTVVNIRPLALR